MLSDKYWIIYSQSFHIVLILVLMEYALWQTLGFTADFFISVLILVLMEYALWRNFYTTMKNAQAES